MNWFRRASLRTNALAQLLVASILAMAVTACTSTGGDSFLSFASPPQDSDDRVVWAFHKAEGAAALGDTLWEADLFSDNVADHMRDGLLSAVDVIDAYDAVQLASGPESDDATRRWNAALQSLTLASSVLSRHAVPDDDTTAASAEEVAGILSDAAVLLARRGISARVFQNDLALASGDPEAVAALKVRYRENALTAIRDIGAG